MSDQAKCETTVSRKALSKKATMASESEKITIRNHPRLCRGQAKTKNHHSQRSKPSRSLEVLELPSFLGELEINVSRVLELRVSWELGVPRELRVLEL